MARWYQGRHYDGHQVTILKPCIDCDELSDRQRCEEHRPKPAPKPNAKAKSQDYDTAWRKLSERARKAQPFCLWCGTTKSLETDHTPTAWERKAAGKPIRLRDIRVLCGPCNILAGQARPGPGQRISEDRPEQTVIVPPSGRNLTTRGEGVSEPRPIPRRRQSLNHTPGGYPAGGLVAPW